ncbi:ABC transporter permease [Candidatus Parcubacteria bacterium]|nr:ABC transporter permease [Candidatus Parcubacteria bacterium]
MFWTNFKRIARTGFMNFWRNGTVSLASVFMMTVTLLVIGFILFGSAVLNTSLNTLRDKVDITVTFVPTAAETDILSMKHSLETLSEVSLVTYTSREDALTAFTARHQNDQSILTALAELNGNPLGAELDVKAKDPSQYQSIADFLQSQSTLSTSGVSIVDHVNFYQNKVAIDRLSSIIRAADKLGLAIAIAFIILSILIAFNTIRLTIYIAREEISVMRLVGASTAYIQGPFVTVGIMYGLLATLASLILFLPITYWIGKVTANFFIGLNLFSYYLHNFPQVFLVLLGSGAFIGAVSSLWAIRRYLKV